MATNNSTFVIPKFSATNPNIDITIATIPQENPLINPEIMLLYSGKTFWAINIVTGVAIIVTNPIITKITSDKVGCEW